MKPPVRGYQTANTMSTLELMAEAPRSVPELADHLKLSAPSARRIMRRLAHEQYVERVPDDPTRRRYRVAARGRALGAQLAQAEQTVEPHRYGRASAH
jgi:DNA-binding IclR family transcriptional regulator